jgi:hypothetical protein
LPTLIYTGVSAAASIAVKRIAGFGLVARIVYAGHAVIARCAGEGGAGIGNASVSAVAKNAIINSL